MNVVFNSQIFLDAEHKTGKFNFRKANKDFEKFSIQFAMSYGDRRKDFKLSESGSSPWVITNINDWLPENKFDHVFA
jgi:hypothetical protein